MHADGLNRLEAFDPKSGNWNVVIETPQGSRNKFKYEPKLGVFKLSKILPQGLAFPFDFGFLPGTLGADGDPLDVLLLMDEPAMPGALVPSRIVGVLTAEQKEKGKSERNDRLIAVAAKSRNHNDLLSIRDLSTSLLEEVEHFFSVYHDFDESEFEPIKWRSRKKAEKLAKEGVKRFRKNGRKSTSRR